MSADDDQPEVLFRAKLQRCSSDTPWGFRLQGGVEFDTPLTLLKVTADSVASQCGLNAGDIVVRLCGQSAAAMTHLMAQQVIANSGNTLEIIVQRVEVTRPPLFNADKDLNGEYTATNDDSPVRTGHQQSAMTTISPPIAAIKSTSHPIHTNRDVVVTSDDVTPCRRNHGDNDNVDDDCEQRQLPDDVIVADDDGHMVSSADQHSNTVGSKSADELRFHRKTTNDATGSEGSSAVRYGTAIFSCSDDFVCKPSGCGGNSAIGEWRSNIPFFNDEPITYLQPVQPLVSTDATLYDCNAYSSTSSTGDTVSDCASEMSDDVASVIEMPMNSGSDDCSDIGDVTLLSADENESGIYPDYDSINDEAVRSPPPMSPPSIDDQSEMNRISFIRSASMLDDQSILKRRPPTSSPDEDQGRVVSSSFLPVMHFTSIDVRPSSKPSASQTIEDIGSHSVRWNQLNEMSVSVRSQPEDVNGAVRRDFSRTAPWRVPSKHRSSVSLLSAAAVGASFSDPDIASSSSASVERIAATSARVANRRAHAELELSRRAQRARPGQHEETQAPPVSSCSSSTVIHLPVAFSSATSPTVTSTVRVTATVAIVSLADGLPIDENKTAFSTAASITASVATTTASPRCYIPQKPPPLPFPGSVGPDLRPSLRNVALRSTAAEPTSTTPFFDSGKTTSAAPDQAPQQQQVLQCMPVVTTRDLNEEAVVVNDEYDSDQVDMPQRPVREMVAELNSRLERCERSTSESIDSGSPLDSPFGSRYDLREAEAARMRRLSSSGSESEKEIFIDTPPVSNSNIGGDKIQPALCFQPFLSNEPRILTSSLSPITARRPPITPTVAYHGTIVYSSSPDGVVRQSPCTTRRFSLPAGSALSPLSYPTVTSPLSVAGGSLTHQRKVRFAEPPESSVIEIESSRCRHRTGGVPDASNTRSVLTGDWQRTRQKSRQTQHGLADGDSDCAKPDTNDWIANSSGASTSADLEYGSVTSLSEKLDRIELEHALASAAMRRSRPFQPPQQQQQPQHQQQHGHQTNEEVPWNHADSLPTVLVSSPPQPVGHGEPPGAGSRQWLRPVPGSPKLEPIRERVIAIQPANSMLSSPERYSTTYYGGDRTETTSGSSPSSPLIGGLRYLFRRSSNAEGTRFMSQQGEPSLIGGGEGGFSVSIGQAAAGNSSASRSGNRISLLVQQPTPGARVNLVFPSSPTSGGGEVGMPSSPPSYEESVRVSGSPAMMRHQRRRSPSLHDFNVPPFYSVNVLPHQHQQQQRHHHEHFHQLQQQQQHQYNQLVASRMGSNSGHSPTSSAAYSQTLQVDTGLRQYQQMVSSSSPRLSTPTGDVQSPLVFDAPGHYGANRPPSHSLAGEGRLAPNGSHPSHDHGAYLRPYPSEHDVGVYHAGISGQQLSSMSTIVPDKSWPRHMLSPEIDYHSGEPPTMSVIPLTTQAMVPSQHDPMDNYSGILAFLDKTFTEKILNWQAQRLLGRDNSEGQLQQSETFKMVQEMDKQQQF